MGGKPIHRFLSYWQYGPEKFSGQSQVFGDTQLPPCWHGGMQIAVTEYNGLHSIFRFFLLKILK